MWNINLRTYKMHHLTPLSHSAPHTHSDCVQVLLECKDIIIYIHRIQGKITFSHAPSNRRGECVCLFLRHIYSSSSSSAFPLHNAIVCEDIHRIQILLSDSAVDVNAPNNNGYRSPTVAMLMNKSELKKLLLQYKDIHN